MEVKQEAAAAPTPKKLKALFVNGGPRRKNNTAQMLESCMKGASDAGAETTMVHLYDLTFSGCKSCFACHLKDAKTDGVCALKDDLRPVLEQARDADILVIGSPVYFSYPTGATRSFLERLLFANHTYDLGPNGEFPVVLRRKRTAAIFTMNVAESDMEAWKYPILLGTTGNVLRRMFGHSEVLYACDTLQFSDYSKYQSGLFDEEQKRRHHDEQFPIDLKKAYELGKRLVEMEDVSK